MTSVRARALVCVVVILAVAPAALAADGGPERYGDIELPRDEHLHPDGWDFWWGSAELVTTSGNRYVVAIGNDALNGVAVSGHEIYARQGPYEGSTIATQQGPVEWGHQGEPAGRYVSRATAYVPGVSELLRYETIDTYAGGKPIAVWERTSLAKHDYRFVLDQDEAFVHPAGENIRLGLDLRVRMRKPPMLAGGTGTWWYGIPESLGYPSRSFQYVQGARRLSGRLEIEQPDGTMLRERIDPRASRMVMIREYDATPEDLPAGLALALATQLHPRYPQYYQGGMPWELLFVDLDNGAQLMVAVIAFHDTDRSPLAATGATAMERYQVLGTLKLPSGESVALDDELRVEHLSYRRTVGRVPTFWVLVTGIWKQAWDYRVSYPGGTVDGPAGPVEVPSFDLGLDPQFTHAEPFRDEAGNGQKQRVPFSVAGSYDRCPIRGYAFSELIINWYGEHDPWFTGRAAPKVHRRCNAPLPEPPPLRPMEPVDEDRPIEPAPPGGCQVFDAAEPCTYVATVDGGVSGYSDGPGGWTVTIERPGEPEPIVITAFGGQEWYACSAIQAGDTVTASVRSGSFVMTGQPGFCF